MESGGVGMLIKDVCQKTGLTKKAIEYYQQKGMISPKIGENGYRYFSQEDVEKLKRISLLRKFDLSADEISKVLTSGTPEVVLREIMYQKEIEHQNEKEKLELLKQLIQGEDMETIENNLNKLFEQSTIKKRLLNLFPGYYGKFISIHFGRFLNIKLETEEQREAYETIIKFLDEVESFNIPKDLQSVIDTFTLSFSDADLQNISDAMRDAVCDFEKYYDENKEILQQYIEYRKTEEYKKSDAARLMELFRKFCETSGYYDVFIPAMRRLSPEYNDYYNKLMEANEKFLEKHLEVKDWYEK